MGKITVQPRAFRFLIQNLEDEDQAEELVELMDNSSSMELSNYEYSAFNEVMELTIYNDCTGSEAEIGRALEDLVEKLKPKQSKYFTAYLDAYEQQSLVNTMGVHPSLMKKVARNYSMEDGQILDLWQELCKHLGEESLCLTLECGKVIREGESYFIVDDNEIVETVLDDGSNPCEEGYEINWCDPCYWSDSVIAIRRLLQVIKDHTDSAVMGDCDEQIMDAVIGIEHIINKK